MARTVLRGAGRSNASYLPDQVVDGQVNKGEKGSLIEYFKWQDQVPVLDENGQPQLGDDGKPLQQTVRLQRPRVFRAVVFNAEQINGLPPLARAGKDEWERHQAAESILQDSGVRILHQSGNRAFYRASTDIITLPLREQFDTADKYYATALHEIGHATGHPKRLNRDLAHPFGSEGYAKEELRAEIASMMLGEKIGIGHDPGQHVAYIGSWVKALQEDHREIFRAATDAERITEYILNREMAQNQEQPLHVPEEVSVLEVQEAETLKNVPERIYINVPYAEKEDAKSLGAKWDRQEKS